MPKIEKWDEVNGASAENRMEAFLESATDSYAIMQLRRTDETAQDRFMNYDWLERSGRVPEIDHYEVVYVGDLSHTADLNAMLEGLYVQFNVARPEDFRGHSLSVSDIVALRQNGVVSCHYVDSVGFRELPGFLQPENYLRNAEMAMEDDLSMLDGIINNGSKEPVRGERPSVLEQLKQERDRPAEPPKRAARTVNDREI
ncbi:MAG: YodL domain-containing protein [Clostridiales bacterium]|nr:YodL domain-containing protein [Clostridiales bacterium]